MSMELPEAYHLTLEQLKQCTGSAIDAEGLKFALDGLGQWLDMYALPSSAIPALKADLAFALENNGGTELIRGLAAALQREIAMVMGLYCNEGGELSSRLHITASKPEYRYTCVTVLDGNSDMASVLTRIRETAPACAQNIIIFNGLADASLPDISDSTFARLPHALGYAHLFSILSSLAKGSIILFSDNGTYPGEKMLARMLDKAHSAGPCFYTAAPFEAGFNDKAPEPYFDLCPPWGFQMFSRSLFETALLPDGLISSMTLMWQSFIGRLGENGVSVATYLGPMACKTQSVFSEANGAALADRWRFLQITGHEPLQSFDSIVVSQAAAAFSAGSRALVIAQQNTSLAAALLRKGSESSANWQFYDGAEEMDAFMDRAAAAIQDGRYSNIIFGIPANRIRCFEELLRLAALALMPGGSLWYYDENLFYAGNIELTLAEGTFSDRPNKCQYNLFFRKRLRDLLFSYGLDLSFERYKPPMDDEKENAAELMSSMFFKKHDAIYQNLSTKFFFCSAVKRMEQADDEHV